MIQSIKFENTTSAYGLTSKLNIIIKIKMRKTFSTKYLSHITATVAALLFLLNIKIMKFINI